VLTRRPNSATDWNQELLREQVLQLRHERWRINSIHILKLARKLAIAWLILRHGVDLTDAATAVISTAPEYTADCFEP
jgi:hypothetical protein